LTKIEIFDEKQNTTDIKSLDKNRKEIKIKKKIEIFDKKHKSDESNLMATKFRGELF